jgi:hypothetical protein
MSEMDEDTEALAGLERYLTGPPGASYNIYVVYGHQLRDWLAVHDAQVQADAWDEGWDVRSVHPEPACPDDYNPYRAAMEAKEET